MIKSKLNYSVKGSAWEYDEPSDEYYLHLYVTKQPDLNWENPDVRAAVWAVLNFWIEKGCDGFRVSELRCIVAGLDLNRAHFEDGCDQFDLEST